MTKPARPGDRKKKETQQDAHTRRRISAAALFARYNANIDAVYAKLESKRTKGIA